MKPKKESSPSVATLAGYYFIVPGYYKIVPSRQHEFVTLLGQLLQYTAFLGRLANPRNVTIPCVE